MCKETVKYLLSFGLTIWCSRSFVRVTNISISYYERFMLFILTSALSVINKGMSVNFLLNSNVFCI